MAANRAAIGRLVPANRPPFRKDHREQPECEASARTGSEGDRIAQDALRYIRQALELGQTLGDLNRSCRSFRALADKRKQMAVLELLQAREDVVRVNMRSGTRMREAWVAVEFWSEREPVADRVATG